MFFKGVGKDSNMRNINVTMLVGVMLLTTSCGLLTYTPKPMDEELWITHRLYDQHLYQTKATLSAAWGPPFVCYPIRTNEGCLWNRQPRA